MKANRFNILCLMLMAMVLSAAAQDASFKLVPPQNIIEGQRFAITFRLANGNANPPAAPELDGCRLIYGPSTSTMSSTQIVNGRATSSFSIDYTYTYVAERQGNVTVPAMSVNVEGKRLSSQPASFKILPPGQGQSQSQGRPNYQPSQPAAQSPAAQISEKDVFVRISFSKSSVYEQEAVIATVKFYCKHDLDFSSFEFLQQPLFEGFLSEELPTERTARLEHFGDENYHTYELNKYLLFPQKAGTLTAKSGSYSITAVTYEIVSMGFMRTRRPVERTLKVSSNSATLQVRALPQPQPEGFNGAVGQYTVTASLKPELLRTDEAATYTYTIKGVGNVKFLKEPKVDFPLGFDSYTPKTDINARFNGSTFTGSYSVDYTIVPHEVGKAEIESPALVYFDPAKGEYVTEHPASFEVNVARGSSTSVVVEQKAIDNTISDIRHIRPILPGQQLQQIHYTFGRGYYWAAYVIAALVLAGTIFVYRRRLKLNADVKGRKLARANRTASKRLKQAQRLMQSGQDDAFYAELARALWGYVSDKLGIAPSQLTRDNISASLEQAGADQEAITHTIEVLDDCEMARFTPQHSREEMAGLLQKASDAISSLENITRR